MEITQRKHLGPRFWGKEACGYLNPLTTPLLEAGGRGKGVIRLHLWDGGARNLVI